MEQTDKKGNRIFCDMCGVVDEYYDEDATVFHDDTPKHLCNSILYTCKANKKSFSKNRDGIIILGSVQSQACGDAVIKKVENTDHQKIRINVKPGQSARFSFSMENNMRNDDVLVVGILLAHPQPHFVPNDHPYEFGGEPQTLHKKSSVQNAVVINFLAADIGQYEMPIIFTFFKPTEERSLVFMRELVVYVQENPISSVPIKSPYTSEHWDKPGHFIRSTNVVNQHMYKVPKLLKILFPRGLNEDALEGLHLPREELNQLRVVLIDTRAILDEGITKENYMIYFHHLLWWEEVIEKINLRKYNMTEVTLDKVGELYVLEVPGLAEKRPSLLRGDRVVIRPVEQNNVHFESYIKTLEDCRVHLAGFDESFHSHFAPDAMFDVRFLMSRVPLERMHDAVAKLHTSKQVCRVFPVPNNKPAKLKTIDRFYNQLIKHNEQQRSAVQHIVSGTSGKAPYIVFGPPGTGKTMTIVEAIIQLVVSNPRNRVLVCTDSNMAADHIAVMLLHYNTVLNISNYLLRANSQSREWTVMPPALAPVSNGTSYENFYPVTNLQMASHRIVVTTLSHAAKYAAPRNQASHKVQMSHLFIDEAAQASEPATLVPICGLLAASGRLVLAGDPEQLGPVCISREVHHRGLGTSLLARLYTTYTNLYSGDSRYITMLVNNFRSDPDILAIPNRLFYDDKLVALARPDPLSGAGVLDGRGRRAVVFHAVHSVEQRMGNAPSYFNERELDMVKRYIKALVTTHQVQPEDIGVIAPYIRQVYKVKNWLTSENYQKIEVGTVESFQGKEKRVIVVTTVRANCKLLDYDAKYSLGFLVDDKRFNVTLTRAKAKLIIIGNPACLVRDRKWRDYMDLCREYDCYFGQETQQLERTAALHLEVKARLNKARILETLNKMEEEKKKKKNKNKK